MWREKNQLCRDVLSLLEQAPGDHRRLGHAWQRLVKLGGHPQTDAERARVELAIQRGQAWEAFQSVDQTPSEPRDQELVGRWQETLFAGWKPAEAQRPALNQARQRLQAVQLLRQLVQQFAQPTPAGEQRIIQQGNAIPSGYGMASNLRERVDQARQRLDAFQRLQAVMHAATSETAIACAGADLGRLQVGHWLDPASEQRVRLAEQRVPLLDQLQHLPTTSSTDESDRQIVAIWHEDLLRDCPEAQPWRAKYLDAARRKELVSRLENALRAGADDTVTKLATDPLLQGCPLSRSLSDSVAAVRQGTEGAHQLIAALRSGDRDEFRRCFDPDLIRRYGKLLGSVRLELVKMVQEAVLPLDKIGLKPFALRRQGLVYDSQKTYRARWTWPDRRFADRCYVGVCSHLPAFGESPWEVTWRDSLNLVAREQYERSGGCYVLNSMAAWHNGYVVVWACVDLGFQSFASEPLVLGRLEGGRSAEGRRLPLLQRWFRKVAPSETPPPARPSAAKSDKPADIFPSVEEFSAEPLPPTPLDEDVQFTVFRPQAVHPEKWYKLLAFAHRAKRPADAEPGTPEPLEEVQRQAEAILGQQIGEFRQSTEDAGQPVPREASLTFVPVAEGLEFDPPRQTVRWRTTVRAEFEMRANARLDGQYAHGQISVLLGDILLADINLCIEVNSHYQPTATDVSPAASSARPYRKIFASYSHQDVTIVEQFEHLVTVFGDRYLRDWTHLRSGEVWAEGLKQLIKEADVFQLFWSRNSMRSPFVRQEYEYALALNRPNFVRPFYWEQPDPEPPPPPQPYPEPPPPLKPLQFVRLVRGAVAFADEHPQEPSADRSEMREESLPDETEPQTLASPRSSYAQEISRQQKTLVVFLLDQSYSMEEPLAGSQHRKMDEVSTVINAWLQDMAIRCTGSEGIRDLMDVAIIGYRTDMEANPIIESPLGGALAGRLLVSIEDIGNNPARIEQKTQQFFDEETGEIISTPVEMPVWVEAKAEGGTPTCSALYKAYEIVEEWIRDHPQSFPPVIIHITDGESQEGDPRPYAEPLRELETGEGRVLLFNCHLGTGLAEPIAFPAIAESLPDDLARMLFDMSSVLPDGLCDKARAHVFQVEPDARGLIYNADAVRLIKFVQLVTSGVTRLV